MALASKNYAVFWKKHSINKPNGEAFFPPEFMDLFESMVELDPENRITIEEIKSHPWYLQNCKIQQADVKSELNLRFKNLNDELL